MLRPFHLASAPVGLGVASVRGCAGADGGEVGFALIEAGGAKRDHPALGADRIRIIGAEDVGDEGHGTRVLGAVLGRAFGVNPACGVAPGVTRAFVASCKEEVAAAAPLVRAAAEVLAPGDVLLLELELVDPRAPGTVFPVEADSAVFEAIQEATARGIVVVEPAGNGGQALETLVLDGQRPFDPAGPAWRDSGALLVGALSIERDPTGVPTALASSGFGARVNVSAWGQGIVTAGIGEGGSPILTDRLGGTSGAAALIAGVALVLQGLARARTGSPLTPKVLRDRLGSELLGTPTDPRRPVGPLPDLARLAAQLERPA